MVAPARWLYHLLLRSELPEAADYAPPSLAREGFIHASYRDAVRESARLYSPAGADVVVLQIDPRHLDAAVQVVATPRGPMPHIHGALRAAAVARVVELDDVAAGPDTLGAG